MGWASLALVGIASFMCVLIGVWPLLRRLRDRSIFDYPNSRSSHSRPTPKGAGLVLIPVIVCGWLILAFLELPGLSIHGVAIVGFLAVGLGILSWIDDLKGVPPIWRLSAHTLAVLVVIELLPHGVSVYGGFFPPYVEQLLIAVTWVWFINLFNFMDGIDGMSGVQTLVISVGVIAISMISEPVEHLGPYAAVIVGGAVGFLVWNWCPAKVFLGDVGSAPLGFLLGWLLLQLAILGEWPAALILPAYYVADATVTLAMRMSRRKPVWQAHREHFYQKAVQAGLSHAAVSLTVLLSGALLVASAMICIFYNVLAGFTVATVVVVGVLLYFQRKYKENC